VIVKERVRLDTEWAAFMIAKGWLKVGLAAGIITLYAYPGTPNHFERTIELSELIGNEEMANKVTPRQVALNEEFAFLEIISRKRRGEEDSRTPGKDPVDRLASLARQ